MELPSATILSAAYDLLQGLPFGAPTFRRPRCGSALCFLTPGSDHDEPLQSCGPPPESKHPRSRRSRAGRCVRPGTPPGTTQRLMSVMNNTN